MAKLSANLSMLFPHLSFLDRFAAAANAGFSAVEFWFPYEHELSTLQDIVRSHDLEVVGLNTAPGNEGEWGIAALPGREDDFRRSFEVAMDYATGLGNAAIHVMAGLVNGDKADAERSYLANMEWALKQSEGSDVILMVEPLNARDRPGYLIPTATKAADVIARFDHPRLRMMFDIYHIQIMEGDILRRLETHLPVINHIQIASVPWRREPDEGELDYAAIFAAIDRLGWTGFVGCEYAPRADTVEGLKWREHLLR